MYEIISTDNINEEKLFYSRYISLDSSDKRFTTVFNGKEISSDEYSIVTHSYDNKTREHIIVKIINKEKYVYKGEILAVKLDHPNIVQYISIEDTTSLLYLYMKKYICDLSDYMLERQSTFTEKIILDFFIQMVEAVKYLHSNKIAHFDIKLENFLIDNSDNIEYPTIMLTDFGFAESWTEEVPPATNISRGSLYYAAPEIFGDIKYPITTPDVWAIGICLFILSTSEYPFCENTNFQTKNKIIECNLEYPKNIIISSNIKSYINKILIKNPFLRPTVFDIFKE
jgi:5'-AMP-activated protein kinase catalytic alpha subunit